MGPETHSDPALTVAIALAVGMIAQVVARHLRIPGIVLLLALGALLIRGRARTPLALLLMGYVALLPVIYGPGPEQRYLYLAAPWLLLGAVSAARAGGVNSRRRLAVAVVCCWAALSAFSFWRWAAELASSGPL